MEGHTDIVRSVSISQDGRRVLSCSPDRTIRLWDVASGKELRRLEGHDSAVHSVAFSPDGRRALSGAGSTRQKAEDQAEPVDCTVRLWDVETGVELHRFEGHTNEVLCVAISPDGKKAASAGSLDDTIRLWKLPP
jgi:WD40 repeat protein